MAAVFIFSAFAIRGSNTYQYPGMTAVQIGMGMVVLMISCGCAAVVVGLFRIKRWARLSVLLLGGLLAFLSTLMSAFWLVLGLVPCSGNNQHRRGEFLRPP
jgi:hypothetical protein